MTKRGAEASPTTVAALGIGEMRRPVRLVAMLPPLTSVRATEGARRLSKKVIGFAPRPHATR